MQPKIVHNGKMAKNNFWSANKGFCGIINRVLGGYFVFSLNFDFGAWSTTFGTPKTG